MPAVGGPSDDGGRYRRDGEDQHPAPLAAGVTERRPHEQSPADDLHDAAGGRPGQGLGWPAGGAELHAADLATTT